MRPLLRPAAVLLLALGGAGIRFGHPVALYPEWMAWMAVATLAWWAAVRAAPRAHGRGALAFVFGVAVLLRLAWLLPSVPLSDDLYRYLWDGRIGNAGVPVFTHAPESDALAPYRDGIVWPRINHPDVSTIYPPVAQYYFRALDAVAPTPAGARAGAAFWDLLTVVALALLLRRRGMPPAGCLVAAWCPLSVLESAGGGHVDPLGAALLVAGLLAWTAARPAGAGLLLALSSLVKPTALLLLPALLRAGSRRRWIAGAAAAGIVTLPFLAEGRALFTGFLTYADQWRFNDSAYSGLLAAGLTARGARLALAGAMLALAVLVPLRLRDPVRAAAVLIGAGIVLSPTVHPWYAIWLVPLLPFLPRALRPAGFAVVSVLPLAYVAAWSEATRGLWDEPGWLRAAVWLPVAAALGAGVLAARQRGPEDGAEDLLRGQ